MRNSCVEKGSRQCHLSHPTSTEHPAPPPTIFTTIARVAAVASLIAFPLLAVAGGACNTGNIQCCNNIEEANSPAGLALLGALGINVQDVTGEIGLQCDPVTVIGGQITPSCSQQPVCCQNNNVGGGVSIGCVPAQL